MKKTLLLALFLFALSLSNKAYSQDTPSDKDDGNRYVVFIGAGEVGDPMITWQKVGNKVEKPSIFTNDILKDETLPMIIIAPEAAAGQIPPGVERLIRNYKQINGEEPVVMLLNKETTEKINTGLKDELDKLGLTVSDNKITVKTSEQEQPNTLKTRFNSKLKDFPTMGTLLIKDALQVFACYYTVYLSGVIKDPAAWQIITFISVNMVVTTGINLFIEEFIKVRSAAANVVKKGIDKTFDAVGDTFQSIKDYIGDFRDKANHKKLLRFTAARMVTDGDITSSKFDGWMRKTTKFLVRGDLAFQTFCVSMPMMFAGWAIWGIPGQAFDFANTYFGMTDTGWWTVAFAGVALTIVNSLSGVPLDLTNSYLNKVGVFSNRLSIWLSLVMEGIWQKDKLGQAGSINLNMIANKLVAYASLPVYLLAHWLSPAANADDIVVKDDGKFNEVMNDLNTALNSVPELSKEAEVMARLQKRERSKLGIGFLDKLFAKPDTQLLLDLTYIMQKYIDDGTFDKAGLSDKKNLENLLENLKFIREDLELDFPLLPDEKVMIAEAEKAVNEARNFNSVKASFWKECGINLKKKTIGFLEYMGWINSKTAEDQIDALAKKAEKLTSKDKTPDDPDVAAEAMITKALGAESIEIARDYLSKASLYSSYMTNSTEIEKKIKDAETTINARPKKELLERIVDVVPDVENASRLSYPTLSEENAKILYAVDYVANSINGILNTSALTEMTMGTPENNFEDALIYMATKTL